MAFLDSYVTATTNPRRILMSIVSASTSWIADSIREFKEACAKVRMPMAEDSLRTASRLVPKALNLCFQKRTTVLRLKQPPQRFAFYQGAF